ncbi:hypothetical protein HYX06_03965 [Candidatus Woesearchaeota archaeon]|nr:hypothetical protein [Candidatus Woesearchaeota archaeon]
MAKKPWLAALLNFILPGVGYLYIKKNKVLSYSLILAIAVGVIGDAATGYRYVPENPAYMWAASLIFLFGFSYDAYRLAKNKK